VPCGTLCKQCASALAYGAFTLSGGPFQNLLLTSTHQTLRAAPLSLATTRGIVSFPQGTKMFQFPWFPRSGLFYLPVRTWACPHVDFSIRTSPAQTAAHTYPELFVVYHVLHRHLTPWHSPCALVASPKLPLRRSTFSRATTFFALLSRYALVNERRAQPPSPFRLIACPPPRSPPEKSVTCSHT
jgi:hypothetical protein